MQVPAEYQQTVDNLQATLPALLQAANLTTANITANLGNQECWDAADGYDFPRCCDLRKGDTGDTACWSDGYDYDSCCLPPAVPTVDQTTACAALGPAGADTQMNLGVMWLKLIEMDDVDPYSHLWQMLFIGASLRFLGYVAMVVREQLNMKLRDTGEMAETLEMLRYDSYSRGASPADLPRSLCLQSHRFVAALARLQPTQMYVRFGEARRGGISVGCSAGGWQGRGQ